MLDAARMQWLIPCAPLLACLCGLLFGGRAGGQRRSVISILGSLCSTIIAAIFLVRLTLIDDPQLANVTAFQFSDWISISAGVPLSLGWGLRIDLLSAMFVTLASLGTLLVTVELSQSSKHSSSGWGYVVLSLMLFGATCFFMSTSFIQMLIGWQIVAVASYLFCMTQPESLSDPASTRKVFFVSRIGDLFWLIVLFVVFDLFQSLNLDAVVGTLTRPADRLLDLVDSRLGQLQLTSNVRDLAIIAYSLIFVAAIRCAQFPFFHWLNDGTRLGPATLSLQQAFVAMPMGIYLLVRCHFLFLGIIGPTKVLATMAGVTALATALIALTRREWQQIFAYLGVSFIGMVFLGLSAANSSGIVHALSLLIVGGTLLGGLILANPRLLTSIETTSNDEPSADDSPAIDRRWILVGILVLGSGLAGQSRLLEVVDYHLTSLQTEAAEYFSTFETQTDIAVDEDSAKAATYRSIQEHGNTYRVIHILGVISTFLFALALLRAYFLIDDDGAIDGDKAENKNMSMAGLLIMVGCLLCVALSVPIAQNFLWKMTPRIASTGFIKTHIVNIFLIAPALGFVTALAMREKLQQQPTPQELNSTAFWPSMKRVCSNGFYLNDIWFFVCSLPIRGLSQFSRFLNWFAIDGLLIGLPNRVSRRVWVWAQPMHNGQLSYYVLAIIVAASTLFVLLTQFKG